MRFASLYQAILGLSLLACGRPAANERTLLATAPAPTRDAEPNPLEWVNASQDEIYSSVDQIYDHPPYLADNDPLTLRLQSWVDTLDRELRATYSERFFDAAGIGHVPHPHLRLMVDSGLNAFVSRATVCYRVPIRFAARPAPASADADKLVLVSSKGVVGLIRRDQVACLDRMQDAVDPSLVVRYLKESSLIEDCSMEAREGAVILAADCRIDPQHVEAGAAGIILTPTSNRITLQTGLVELFDQEEQLVNTIFHELAHFYRSHGPLAKSRARYFYRRTPENLRLAQPQADPSLDELGESLVNLPRFRTQPIAAQRWHSELFSYSLYAINLLIDPACREAASACHLPCQGLRAIVEDPQQREQFGRFPQAQLTGAALQLYFQWEAAWDQCLGAIGIAAEGGQAMAAFADVQKVFWKSQAPEPMPSNWSVRDAALAMNEQLNLRDQLAEGLLQRGLNEGLGYYTTEEEADNLALEWLPLVGLEPRIAVEHWLTYGARFAEKEQDSPFNYSYSSCRELYEAKPRWTLDGKTVPVPVGSFAEPHHSTCYRIWNLDQRIESQAPFTIRPRWDADSPRGEPYQILRSRILELHRRKGPSTRASLDMRRTA